MSVGEPAASETLDRARRELGEIGVATQVSARGDTLEGEISTSDAGGIMNPASWEAMPRVSFTVDAEGRMALDAPPALGGLVVDFRGSGSATQLVARIRHALRERFERVEALRDRLQRMGLKAGVDSERLVAVARVDLDVTGVVELEGGDFGLVARRLVPAMGDRTPVPLGDVAVDLDELPDRVDVELCVAHHAEKALGGRRSSRGQESGKAKVGSARRSSKDEGPTLELLAEKLGGDAVPHPGFAVSRSLVMEGAEATFTARLAERSKFVARLSCGSARLWEGEFDLGEVTHLDEFIVDLYARVGQGGGGTARPSRRQWSDADEELVAGLLPPGAGEVWVLDVQVEDDDGTEVRYVGLNIAGKPSGATRVLPKPSFERTFVAAGAGYRMLASVVEVGADYVIYQTLDAARKPASSPRRAPLIVFMANFTPESANY